MAVTDPLSSGATVQTGGLNAATASGAASGTNASQAQLSSDVNFFLKMLTTQLKNQDPTSPLDTNQFTQQIAQYSSVQQQVNTNTNLEKLLLATKQSGISTAVSYLGREVEIKGNSGDVTGGQGAFSYILPKNVQNADITIKNASGAVVFSGQGAIKEGRNIVVWDAVNSTTKLKEPDGTYTIAVTAKDSAGAAVTVETRAVTLVGGVETDAQGNTLLSVGNGAKINFTDILAVRDPSRAAIPG